MKIYFWSNGDRSVGLNGDVGCLEIEGYNSKQFFEDMSDEKEERENFRNGLREFLSSYLDSGRIIVEFDDERLNRNADEQE